jgi:pimeloyl-ACP methyl ester carboxylesterase
MTTTATAPATVKMPASEPTTVTGVEHWTHKGDVRLFLWEKYVGSPEGKPALLFVHGSSMASQPTFDLTVPGRPDSSVMDWFAQRGFVCWTVDMEGYGRSDKNRDIYCDISNGADDLAAATDYIARTRGIGSFMAYGISSGALRAALFAQRHPDRVARLALDAFVWTGEGAPTLAQRRKKLPEFLAQKRRPIDRAFVYSIFERDHPDCAEKRVVDAFADAILALDDSMPNGTYIDMCSKLPVVDPALITMPNHRPARAVRRHRRVRRPDRILQAPPASGQAVLGAGRRFARQLPAEELPDRLSHPARVLHAAGACLRGRAPVTRLEQARQGRPSASGRATFRPLRLGISAPYCT